MRRNRFARPLALLLALALVAVACLGCGGGEAEDDGPYAGLLFTPVLAETPANELEDEELLALFTGQVYPNAVGLWYFINGNGLELDSETELPNAPENTRYVLVENIQTEEELRDNYRAAFSQRFCDVMVFPFFLEGQRPMFLEEDGRLYFNSAVSGGFSEAFDLARAVVTEKAADGFTVEAPMATGPDMESWVLFGIQNEDGLWLVETVRILQ